MRRDGQPLLGKCVEEQKEAARLLESDGPLSYRELRDALDIPESDMQKVMRGLLHYNGLIEARRTSAGGKLYARNMSDTGRRTPETVTDEYGKTTREAGRHVQFVYSPSGTVHKRDPLPDDDGYFLDPTCGQQLPEGSVWGVVGEPSPEEIAKRHPFLGFCSNCFANSRSLEQLAREHGR